MEFFDEKVNKEWVAYPISLSLEGWRKYVYACKAPLMTTSLCQGGSWEPLEGGGGSGNGAAVTEPMVKSQFFAIFAIYSLNSGTNSRRSLRSIKGARAGPRGNVSVPGIFCDPCPAGGLLLLICWATLYGFAPWPPGHQQMF